MKNVLKSVALAAVVVAATSSNVALAAKAAPAAAPASSGGVNGVAVADLDAVLGNSAALKAAQTQRDTYYKAQIDQAKTRQAQIEAQLNPLVEKFKKDREAKLPAATLQGEVQQIQQIQEAGKAELEKILEPVRLSDAYVIEQLTDKRAAAVQAAMTKAGVTLLLNPQAVLAFSNGYSLNQQILTELDATTPSVQIVPPAGWLPRELREQQAQQAAQQARSGGGR